MENGSEVMELGINHHFPCGERLATQFRLSESHVIYGNDYSGILYFVNTESLYKFDYSVVLVSETNLSEEVHFVCRVLAFSVK